MAYRETPRNFKEGEKFNSLTIKRFIEYKVFPTGKRKPMVECLCDCGRITVAHLIDVRRGSIKTCGNKEAHPYFRPSCNNRPIDHGPVGARYGKLTVVEAAGFHMLPGGGKVPRVRVVCDCGESKEVSLWDLKQGRTKTCGLNHPHYEDRWRPAFNQYYRHMYKAAAQRRGLSFDITEEDFLRLTKMECHYCGDLDSNIIKTQQDQALTSEYRGNGLDRVDNLRGYSLDNVVPCCNRCNHAKHTMGAEEFIDLALAIASRWSSQKR